MSRQFFVSEVSSLIPDLYRKGKKTSVNKILSGANPSFSTILFLSVL